MATPKSPRGTWPSPALNSSWKAALRLVSTQPAAPTDVRSCGGQPQAPQKRETQHNKTRVFCWGRPGGGHQRASAPLPAAAATRQAPTPNGRRPGGKVQARQGRRRGHLFPAVSGSLSVDRCGKVARSRPGAPDRGRGKRTEQPHARAACGAEAGPTADARDNARQGIAPSQTHPTTFPTTEEPPPAPARPLSAASGPHCRGGRTPTSKQDTPSTEKSGKNLRVFLVGWRFFFVFRQSDCSSRF